MNDNVDIIICTHKDFTPPVSNSVYKVFDSRKFRDKYKICGVLDDVELSEHYAFQYVAEHIELKDYVGFCHYRRYFSFLDNIPNMDNEFANCDCLVRKPLKFQLSIRDQYAANHNVEDLDRLGEILKTYFPDYYQKYTEFINGDILIPCNMFIMKKDDFLKYASFMKNVMKEYFWHFGIDCKKRVDENKEKYIKTVYPTDTVEYQERIFAFIFERLTNVYIFKTFKNIRCFDVVITENKYNIDGTLI